MLTGDRAAEQVFMDYSMVVVARATLMEVTPKTIQLAVPE